MKALLLGSLSCSLLLSAAAAIAAPPFSLPPQAVKVAKGVYDLGQVKHNGRWVQGYAFLYPAKGFARPDRSAAKGGNGGSRKGGSTTSSCYTFIGSGAKWRSAESFLLDSSNIAGLPELSVEPAIVAGMNAWNSQVDGTIFGSRATGDVDGADTLAPDNKNEIMFGAINEPGVIAVTITWGIFSGPPSWRELVEWDQIYDDVDFTWGDASVNSGAMDIQAIAAHELGHAAGMGHPDSTCVDETMFATASNGETNKRDLHAGDISGVKKLYK